MPEPTSCAGCCVRTGTYCDRCDLLVGLPGLHVIKVVDGADRLTVTVESPPAPAGCPVSAYYLICRSPYDLTCRSVSAR
jgi:transposase